jgi:hypothetical protein
MVTNNSGMDRRVFHTNPQKEGRGNRTAAHISSNNKHSMRAFRGHIEGI